MLNILNIYKVTKLPINKLQLSILEGIIISGSEFKMKSYSRVGRQVTEWDEAAYKKFVGEELTLIRFGNWKSVQDIFFKSEWIRDVLLFLLVILKVLDFE